MTHRSGRHQQAHVHLVGSLLLGTARRQALEAELGRRSDEREMAAARPADGAIGDELVKPVAREDDVQIAAGGTDVVTRVPYAALLCWEVVGDRDQLGGLTQVLLDPTSSTASSRSSGNGLVLG